MKRSIADMSQGRPDLTFPSTHRKRLHFVEAGISTSADLRFSFTSFFMLESIDTRDSCGPKKSCTSPSCLWNFRKVRSPPSTLQHAPHLHSQTQEWHQTELQRCATRTQRPLGAWLDPEEKTQGTFPPGVTELPPLSPGRALSVALVEKKNHEPPG